MKDYSRVCKVSVKKIEVIIGLFREGNQEGKSASFSFAFALGPNSPMMRLNQCLGDGQANAAASARSCPGFICAVKAVEYEGELFGRDPDPAILY